MVRYCCVPHCWNNGVHRFPKDPKISMQWRIAIKRKCPGNTDKLWQPSGSSRLCRHHFCPEDYELGWRAGELIKKLKHGSIPTLNLPKTTGQLLPNPYTKHPEWDIKKRKAPKQRETLILKTFASFCNTAKRLATSKKLDWNISVSEDVVKAIKPDPDGYDQNQYTVMIQNGFKIRISCYSWCLPGDHHLMTYDFNKNSFASFLKDVESSNLCKGAHIPIGVKDLTVIDHKITKTGESDSHEPLISKCLGMRPKRCAILVKQGEGICWACVEKNRSLAMIIATNQEKEMSNKKHAIKRFSDLDPTDLGGHEPKCSRLAEKATKTSNSASVSLHSASEPSPTCPFRKENIVSKESWIIPALKQADGLPKTQQQLFVEFWKIQMEKLYATTPRPRAWHYPKELMEFWSEIWKSGKHTYKRLVDSGLIGMPSCSTVKKHIKKKMKNLDKSISEVVTGMSEVDKAVEEIMASQRNESISQVADLHMHELTDLFKGQDFAPDSNVATSDDVVLEAVQSAELSMDNRDEEDVQDSSTGPSSETMDVLIVDHVSGTTKKITLPISALQSEDSDYICIPPDIQEVL